MTVLGVLFVTGLAFMATMNFDAEVIMAEKQLGKTTPSVGAVIEEVGSLVVEAMLPSPGEEMTGEPVGSIPASFAEMPGVHNLFAPIEPYWTYSNENYFRWVTDIASLNRRPFQGATHLWDASGLRTDLPNGVPWVDPNDLILYPDREPIVPVDADGDGIVDSVQVELLDEDPGDPEKKWTLAIDRAHLDRLRQVVNPPSNPDGKVFLGLRILAHGGMVDLNHSHESLIRAALWYPDAAGKLPQQSDGFKPYDATLEEPMLRRRNLLPSRLLSSSRIQGIPLADPADDRMADDFTYPLSMFGGDFARRLFPAGETPREHRYSPFAPDEFDAMGLNALWNIRMDPRPLANMEPEESQYDWRHLVTTVSHDDLLRRETWVEEEVAAPGGGMQIKRTDVLELMIAANERYLDGIDAEWNEGSRDSLACRNLRKDRTRILPFEYAAYPHGEPYLHVDDAGNLNEDEEPDIYWDKYQRAIDVSLTGDEIDEGVVDGMLRDWCKCQGDPKCTLHPLKGKLRLSLPWLEDAMNNGVISELQGIRLIQDAFTMMLLNSRRSEWGEWHDLTGTSSGDWDGDGIITLEERAPRVWKYFDGALMEISRTAASLTANLIDFADADDIPTRVELRSADFRPLTNTGGDVIYDVDGRALRALGLGTCSGLADLGDSLSDQSIDLASPLQPCEYVYGLERQPFITEVAAEVVDDGNGAPDPALSAFAVELFTPCSDPKSSFCPGADDLDASQYYLRVNASGNLLLLPVAELKAGDFTAFKWDPNGKFPTGSTGEGSITNFTMQAGPNDNLSFEVGDTVYLIRKVGPAGPEVVVDQFDVSDRLADVNAPQPQTIERTGVWNITGPAGLGTNPWLAPIPAEEASIADHSLGERNTNTPYDSTLPAVEVLFANTKMGRCDGDGPICSMEDNDCGTGPDCVYDPNVIGLRRSFPTTGSLLLLMRHANSKTKAFTTYLDDEDVAVMVYRPNNPPALQIDNTATSSSRREIDNGRMPVFDVGHLHHLDPAIKDPTAEVPQLGDPDPRFTHPYPDPAGMYDPGEPGGLRNVPWGQLVFDYFTALPLSSPGPYAYGGDEAIPRVDEAGLRVHGRININAAPWAVLAGLPFVPIDRIPGPFQYSFITALGNKLGRLTDDDGNPLDPTLPASLGPELAKAIVAYREARNVGVNTGDYDYTALAGGNPEFGRGWQTLKPTVRRGTGFISVGELANVRHAHAWPRARFDAGEVQAGTIGSYVEAIAPLAALADWVTVRSQVFTIYGVLRGEDDETLEDKDLDEEQQEKVMAADVNSRAIRFQETVDRLPVFLDERSPKRIGKRTVTKYTDFRND